MGTIANKLEYLDDTKTLLAEKINDLGGNIDNSTTFREYAQELDNIYSNLPKTTGEGTSITLTPTLKGKLLSQIKGNTEQDGTPTPSTPIDIEVVTGTQEVKVENVNLFDGETEIGGYNSSGVKYSDNTLVRNKNIIQVLPNTQYIISNNGTGVGMNVCEYNADQTHIQNRNISGGSSFTTTANTYYLNFFRGASNTDKLQLEYGNSISSYTPHQEQTYPISLGDIELCKIGNYQDYLYKSNDKWYKKEYIEKEVFTGASSESWYSQRSTNPYVYAIHIDNYKRTEELVCKCNYFTSIINGGYGSMTNGQIRFRYYTDSDNVLYVCTSDITSVENLKTWLSTHNTEVRYVLATPNDIEITDTTLIEQLNNIEKMYSYNGTTNISSSGNLAMVLSVSAIKGE